MAIHVICGCGKSFDVPDAYSGKTGKCNACGSRLTLSREAYANPNATCPSCGLLIEPPPKRSRKCPHCRLPILLRNGRLFVSENAFEVFESERQSRERSFEIAIFCGQCYNEIVPIPAWSTRGPRPVCLHCRKDVTLFYGRPGETLVNTTERFFWQLIVKFDHSCALCIQYATYIGAYHPIPLHAGCKCEQIRISPGDTSLPFIDFRAELGRLDEDQQFASLGRYGWLLYRTGRVQWDDIVTPARIRDIGEVVERGKVTVAEMVACGISEDEATAIWNEVYTPEYLASQQRAREAISELRLAGLSKEEIVSRVAESLVSRLRFGGSKPNEQEE